MQTSSRSMANSEAPFTVRRTEDAIVVQIEVENLLALPEVAQIGNQLNDLVKNGSDNLVLDVAKVRYAGSAALGMLISLTKTLQEQGKRLVLTGTQHIDGLLKISRTRTVFTVADDTNA